jgi:uncharacterized protein YjiS (DUF1127 family)
MKSQLGLLNRLSLRYLKECLDQYLKQLALYKHRYSSRKALLRLDENRLRDIGISKQQAEEEANKPFWKGHDMHNKQQNSLEKNLEQNNVETHSHFSLNECSNKVIKNSL